MGLRDGFVGQDSLDWLSGGVRDEVGPGVVMQDGDTFPLGDGGQQVGEADCPDLSAAPQGALYIQGPPPVLIVGGEPFVTSVAVSPQLVRT